MLRLDLYKIFQGEKKPPNKKTERSSGHRKFLAVKLVVFFLIVFSLGAAASYFYFSKNQPQNLTASLPQQVQEQKNIYIEFLSEIYDKIKENYWDNITDVQLSNLFNLGTEKLVGAQPTLKSNDKNGLKDMWTSFINNLTEEKKKEFSTKLAEIVLANLNPPGRSGLYTEKKTEELNNMVQNVNPETGQTEPTVLGKIISPKIFYLRLIRFSPTTFDEFQKIADSVSNQKTLDTLILNLRGNIGGSIDILPYFLGPFIGQNQYAYEFFRKGEAIPYKTKIGWLPSLVQYKKVVILIDGRTQSTAELMAATLKKYNVGVLLGTKTLGWGTVEKVYQLNNQIDPDEKYSIFLVNHLALRDDGQPIEGKGVEPTINIEDANWETQLFSYFNFPELIKAVKETWDQASG